MLVATLREVKPPELNFSLGLRSLTSPLYKPLKLSSDKHLTWKTCFLLVFALAERVSELRSLSYHDWHSFVSDFVAKTQNPLIHDHRFKKFSIPSLDDFAAGDTEDLLLCLIRALRKYLLHTEQYCPKVSSLFISAVKKKWVS